MKSGSICFQNFHLIKHFEKNSTKIPQYHGRTDFVCAKQKTVLEPRDQLLTDFWRPIATPSTFINGK